MPDDQVSNVAVFTRLVQVRCPVLVDECRPRSLADRLRPAAGRELTLQSVEKLSKRCTIKLTTTSIHLICAPGSGGVPAGVDETGGVQVWSSVVLCEDLTDLVQTGRSCALRAVAAPR